MKMGYVSSFEMEINNHAQRLKKYDQILQLYFNLSAELEGTKMTEAVQNIMEEIKEHCKENNIN